MVTLALSALVSIIAYSVVYYVIMPKDIQERSLNFHIHRESDRSNNYAHTAPPSLLSHVKIGSSLAGYLHLTGGSDFEIRMDSEYYNIDVIFNVVENSHNLDNLNFYLTTKLGSYNPTQIPITFHRMGTMEYKGTLKMIAKEIMSFIPFCSYIGLCSDK